jgi:hypothetical protein
MIGWLAGVLPVVAYSNSWAVNCERYHSAPFGSTLIEPNSPIASEPPLPSPPVVAAVEYMRWLPSRSAERV